MYVAKPFHESNQEEINTFIYENGFATIVSVENKIPVACHVPIELSVTDGKRILTGHISKANPQWKLFNTQDEVLVIFTSPSAYISSAWYNHNNVPTTNYISIHVYGKVRLIENYEELYRLLKSLISKYESANEHRVKMEDYSEEFLRVQMKSLIGFQIIVNRVEANFKLSQNRTVEDHENVVKELKVKNDAASIYVAREMEKKKNPKLENKNGKGNN